MIDCGEATQLRCKRFNIKLSKIDHILISHLHGDHYLGLMGILSTMHLYGRKNDLFLVGPPGLSEIITIQLRYSETRLNFHIKFSEWIPNAQQVVMENEKLTIETIPLDHRVPCSGYLIKEKPKKRRFNKALMPVNITPVDIARLKNGFDLLDDEGNILYKNSEVTFPPNPNLSYAYCSDTRFKPALVEQLAKVDLLYHESTFADDMKDRAHETFHSTAKEAAQMAKSAGAGKLLLGHFSTRYKDLGVIIGEARSVFKESYLANEGETFTIPAL